MGRLKFLVKDYRSEGIAANIDSDNLQHSPIKKAARCQDASLDGQDFAEEEEVEIECGIA